MSRKMKDSGIEWIGEIPEDWNVANSKYFIEIKSGKSLVNEMLTDFSKYPVYGGGKLIGFHDEFNSTEDNLIIGRVGANCGSIIHLKQNAWATDNALVVTTNLNTRLVFYILLAADLNRLNDSNAQPLITSTKILNLEIPVYLNYTIQQKIANFLDKKVSEIDLILDKTRESIEEYKKYKQSIITEAVTKGLNPDVKMKDSGIEWIGEIPEHWDTAKPFRVCEIIRGNCGFQKNDLKDVGEFVALQYGKTYKVDEVNNEFKFYVDASFYKENQLVNKGDTILISTSETLEDLGYSCLYNRDDIGLLGGEQMCLKPNNQVLMNKFLYYATTYFNIELNQFATGLKVFRFKVDDLKKINIIIPPLDEQSKIISFLDAKMPLIEKMILSKESLITDLEAYRKSLIYECVTGKREVI